MAAKKSGSRWVWIILLLIIGLFAAFVYFLDTKVDKGEIAKPAEATQKEKDTLEIEALLAQENTTNFYPYRELLGNLFYEKVGIVRENKQLNEALEEVIEMQIAQKTMGISDKSIQNNQNLIDFLEFKNTLLLAPTIISSAIARDESRGAHYKLGFESENEDFRNAFDKAAKETIQTEIVEKYDIQI